MAKEITMYEARDGKCFKTQKGANNHDKKLLVEEKLVELNMTKDEITAKLEKVATYNKVVRVLLNEGDWTTWNAILIAKINNKLFKPEKKTIYFIDKRNSKEEVLAEESGVEFSDPKLHVLINGKYDEYEIVEVVEENEFTRKVKYDLKYDTYEIIEMKIKDGEDLGEYELRNLAYYFQSVYEEDGEDGRWTTSVTTVFEIDGNHYALEWGRALTEMQEDTFYEQPFKVKMEEVEKTIVVKQTKITKI